MKLENKHIVVTGGASGIGQAGAICCAQEGARVAVVDIDEDGINSTVQQINDSGGNAEGYRVDVREEDQVSDLFEKIGASFGHINGLIHAAGILEGAFVQVDDFEELTWDRVLDINLKGSFLISKYTVPLIEKAGSGVMVLIASGAGVKGGSSSVAYGSSKGGVHGLSLVLAQHLANRNIRVHGVCPGGIQTPLKVRQVQVQADQSGSDADKIVARLGDPKGVGKILSFLVSDEADYVRGTIFTR